MTKPQLKKDYQTQIKKIVNVIKTYDPERIILFGSLACGKIHSDSDIDICFIKENSSPLETKRALRELLWEKGYTWEKEPDFHVYEPKTYKKLLAFSDPFVTEVAKGKTVYVRQV